MSSLQEHMQRGDVTKKELIDAIGGPDSPVPDGPINQFLMMANAYRRIIQRREERAKWGFLSPLEQIESD